MPTAKYIFTGADPSTDFLSLAVELQKSDTLSIKSSLATVSHLSKARDAAEVLPTATKTRFIGKVREEDTALVLAYCYDTEERHQATLKALGRLTNLNPMPLVVLIELLLPGRAIDKELTDLIRGMGGLHSVLIGTEDHRHVFHKEDLFNYTVRRDLKGIKYLIFLDSDTYPLREDWVADVREKLRLCGDGVIIQPWSTVVDTLDSSLSGTSMAKQAMETKAPWKIHSHSGLCVAMTSGCFDSIEGFPVTCPCGAGDVMLMFEASGGNCDDSSIKEYPYFTASARKIPQKTIDFVECGMVHVWHGNKTQRGYKTSHDLLQRLWPIKDSLGVDDRGLLTVKSGTHLQKCLSRRRLLVTSEDLRIATAKKPVPRVTVENYNLLTYFSGCGVQPREVALVTLCKKDCGHKPMHVHWFLEQACKYIKTPFRFVCLTDYERVPGRVPLLHNWTKKWSKLEAFRPGLFHNNETVIYLDLEVVLSKDFVIPTCPNVNDIVMTPLGKEFSAKFGSNFMVWQSPFTKPYDWFCKRPEKTISSLPSNSEVIISTVLTNGGKIVRASEVDSYVSPKEEAPIYPPKSSLFFTRQPWKEEREWILPLTERTGDIGDIALISVFFGGDELRLQSAVRGARHLCSSPEFPGVRLAVELVGDLGQSSIPDWTGDIITIPTSENSTDIWQKEVLMNIGARHIMEKYPDIKKLLFVDMDVYPATDWKDCWLEMTSKALDRGPVVQPWRVSSEDNQENTAYRSYAWLKAAGARKISHGQGFSIAMTVDFYKAMGGFPEHILSASNDILAILQIDTNASLAEEYISTWEELSKAASGYAGPKTEIGWLPCELKHARHGKRDDSSVSFRGGNVKNYLWDTIEGIESAVEKNKDGLWQWKEDSPTVLTPFAKAVRKLQSNCGRFFSIQDVMTIWAECKKEVGL